MNLMTGESADEYFGGEVPLLLKDLLRQAQQAAPDERAALLWTAHTCAPQTLAVYYLLYKHHAGRRELELAERAARGGLAEAARQAGLPDDTVFDAFELPPLPPGTDFQQPGPARFWLFTQKALAFIALRDGRAPEARRRLALIDRLLPASGTGSDVVSALLQATEQAGSPPADV